MISVQSLKQYLKIDGTTNDSFLAVCIDGAVKEIETYCNRKFEAGTYIDYLNGDNNSRFQVKNYPLTSISLIETRLNDEWSELTDGTCLFILPEINGVQLEKTVLPRGENNVKITYTAGWNEDESEIKTVVLELASLKYYDSPVSGQARLGISSENMGSQASTSNSYKELDWKSKVAKYRKRRF